MLPASFYRVLLPYQPDGLTAQLPNDPYGHRTRLNILRDRQATTPSSPRDQNTRHYNCCPILVEYMLKICCLCLNTDREDRTPDLLGVNQLLIPAELCQYMYMFIILSSLVHIQTIPAWNLWELNPSDFLLARQTTTPCSPKPHLPSLIRCLGFTFRLQTITFLFIYLVRKPFNYREH